eukprot:239665-Hanusia_phi.AAC.1
MAAIVTAQAGVTVNLTNVTVDNFTFVETPADNMLVMEDVHEAKEVYEADSVPGTTEAEPLLSSSSLYVPLVSSSSEYVQLGATPGPEELFDPATIQQFVNDTEQLLNQTLGTVVDAVISASRGLQDANATESDLKQAQAPAADSTYYSLIRLTVDGTVPEGLTLQQFLNQQVQLYVATFGAQVSQYISDYVTQVLTNHVDPASGLSGNHRRLMLTLGNSTEVPPNTTAVIVALQSQTWTQMQAVTAAVNARSLAASIAGRNILQVEAVASTVSYALPGPAEALNFLKRTSPSLTALSGMQYDADAQRWHVRMDLYQEAGTFTMLYVTRSNGYSAGDVNNPCVQPTATMCCVWDVMSRYWTPSLPLNYSCSAGLTAEQFFASLGSQKTYVEMGHSGGSIQSYYASAADRAAGVLTVEMTEAAVEQLLGTAVSTSATATANRFGIGMLVIRPNPSNTPDSIIDFTVFDIFSVNNFLFSVRTSQDYTVLSNVQVSLNEVFTEPQTNASSADAPKLYYANVNFVIPQTYRLVPTTGNILAYLGTQQLPLSDAAAWQSPCMVYGSNPQALLSEDCQKTTVLNFCQAAQHNFLNRPGINVNLQIPFNPDLSIAGQQLYVSMLLELASADSDVSAGSPSVFTNVVFSVPMAGFVKRCAPVIAAAVQLPNNYITVSMSTGLQSGASITTAVNSWVTQLGLESKPLASYSIDLT